MIGCLFLGLGTSLGGLIVLGFIKCFPPIVFSGFSSGTGFAGLFGATCYLFLKMCNASFEFVLGFIASLYPIYFFAFRSLLKFKFETDSATHRDVLIEDYDINQENVETIINNSKPDLSRERLSVDSKSLFNPKAIAPIQTEDLSDFELNEAKINQLLTYENCIKILSLQKISFFLFFAMYFLEYFSITELADRLSSIYQSSSEDFKNRMIFADIQLLYQLGVFVARSSLDFLQIKGTGRLVWLLFIVVGCQFFQFMAKSVFGIIWLYGIFVLVGVLGGLGYSNIMFEVISHPKSEKKSKVKIKRNLLL
jgi:hypothetical protein